MDPEIDNESLETTPLPSYLVEFDLDSILEYSGVQNTNHFTPKRQENIQSSQQKSNESTRSFNILSRKWVSHVDSPIALNKRVLMSYVGRGVTCGTDRFIICITDFEFKNTSSGEPSVTIMAKQRGQMKRRPLLSMHVADLDLDDEIRAEIRFMTLRMRKCKPHFAIRGMRLNIELFSATKKVVISVSYMLDMVISFHRFFSSDVSVALNTILSPRLKVKPVQMQEFSASFGSLPMDNHLFYTVITDKTRRMAPSSQEFAHPSLRTKLLPFQRKSVSWLLSKENVAYDEMSRKSTHSPLISSKIYNELLDYSPNVSDQMGDSIHAILSQLCFGWNRVLYRNDICWYNSFTGNIMSEPQIVAFLLYFYRETNSVQFPGCGLLSEEMGLGKTVEITTLIQLNPRTAEEVGSLVSLQFKQDGDFRLVKKAKTTLIAAPESIIRQWYSEICQICPSLSVTIYKGLGKYPELNNLPHYIAEFLQSYDIVLLNYSTLSKETDYANYSSRHKPTRGQKRSEPDPENDYKETSPATNIEAFRAQFHVPEFINSQDVALSQKRLERTLMTELAQKIAQQDLRKIPHTQYYESPLMSCQWWRVVLDEVQMVSSGSTRAFATASILPRFHSWGVSGTPSMSPAVLQFLKFSPFNYDIQKHCWKLLTASENGNQAFIDVWSSLAIRHTKDMVYRDIQLPPQSRILLKAPFTDVEQDKYKEILESTLAYIGIKDIQASGTHNLDASSFSHLRTWLFRLRQLCGNLQVGKLPKTQTLKGKNKSKFLISGVKELKTLEEVLADMIRSVDDDVGDCERSVVNRVLDICSALEHALYPRKVIQILNLLLERVRQSMVKSSRASESDKSRFRVVEAALIEKGALTNEEEFEDQINDASGNHLGAKLEIEEIDDQKIGDYLSEYQTLKERLSSYSLKARSWKLIEHKCYFYLASAHFQLHDIEYQEKISRLIVPFDAVNEAITVINNSGVFPEITAPDNSLKPEDTDSVGPSDVQDPSDSESSEDFHKLTETKFYALAEGCRRDILRHSIAEVSKITTKRIGEQNTHTETWTNDGRKTFPKSSKKLFRAMPMIEAESLSHLVSNVKCRQVVTQFNHVSHRLNTQAEVINSTMEKLLKVLSNPLNSDQAADGAEFEQSVQDQEQASCYMLVLSQMLTDRANAVFEMKTTVTEIERQQEIELRQEAQRVSDRAFLKQIQSARLKVKPDVTLSMEEVMEDCRLLEAEFRDNSLGGDRRESLNVLSVLRTIFENEKTSQTLLKKELNTSLNMVFNSRVEYFRQLQQISDSVQNDTLKIPRESTDADTLDILFQNLYRNLAMTQNKLTKSIARSRYLATLAPGDSGADIDRKASEADGETICIICQSGITTGSLTFCGHKFCKDCLAEWLKRSPKCPMCKAPTDSSTVYGFTSNKSGLKAHHLDDQRGLETTKSGNISSVYKEVDENTLEGIQKVSLPNSYGSKVDLIVKQVVYLKCTQSDVQIVVFSQWQDLLVILAFAFDKAGISYVSARDSHVSAYRTKKTDPVEEFKSQSDIKTCFLLNAQAQASGLTLINATHIFLCEPLLNTSTELQAISRIHRIGQTNHTTVWMFAIENSVEENIVSLGSRKRLDYYKANAKESKSCDSADDGDVNMETLEDNELRAAESFALTVGPSTSKKTSENTEFVEDADLHKIYFGVDS